MNVQWEVEIYSKGDDTYNGFTCLGSHMFNSEKEARDYMQQFNLLTHTLYLIRWDSNNEEPTELYPYE